MTDQEIEMEALKTIRAGYEAENEWRARRGEAAAYGVDHFQELAELMRALKTDRP